MSRYLDALLCKNFTRPPVWIMRQAGRYLPSYQEYKRRYSLKELFSDPELIAEITELPLKEFPLDAAILFSDILLPLEVFGFEVLYNPKPTIIPKISSPSVLTKLTRRSIHEVLPHVFQGIRYIKERIKTPLIGFCGGPFSVAAYAFEENKVESLKNIKAFYHHNSLEFRKFMSELTDVLIEFLQAQIQSGVDAVQVFDSWAGLLDSEMFEDCSLRYLRKIVKALEPSNVPITIFMRGACLYARELTQLKPSAISFDWQRPISELRDRCVPNDIAVQGNLDPAILRAPLDVIKDKTLRLLSSMENDPGFIVNLGHGIEPDITVDAVKVFTETVAEYSEMARV